MRSGQYPRLVCLQFNDLLLVVRRQKGATPFHWVLKTPCLKIDPNLVLELYSGADEKKPKRDVPPESPIPALIADVRAQTAKQLDCLNALRELLRTVLWVLDGCGGHERVRSLRVRSAATLEITLADIDDPEKVKRSAQDDTDRFEQIPGSQFVVAHLDKPPETILTNLS